VMGVSMTAALGLMGVPMAAGLGVLVGAHVRGNLVPPKLPPPPSQQKYELFQAFTNDLRPERLRARGARGNMGHV
jgi:hypothetical protein